MSLQKNIKGREDVMDWQELPVPIDQRIRTDIICTIINTAFVVILFIICVCMLNTENLRKMTYPLDGEGNLCGYDFPDHPYLYYTSSTDPVKRLCVSKCPKEGDTRLECNPTASLSCEANDNPKYQVQIVDTEMVINRVGIFCFPTDEEERKKIEDLSHVNKKNRFMGFYDAFWAVLGWSVLAGVIYFALIFLFPKGATRWFFIIGTAFEVIGAFLLLLVPNGWIPARIALFVILMALAAMSAFTLYKGKYRKKLLVCSEMIQCAVEAFKVRWQSALYILLFTALFGILIVLVCFQILCVWSDAQFVFDPQVPFYQVSNAGGVILTIFIFFEFYWGMSFLKEAFNFCVSGYATSWYYYNDNKSRVNVTLSLRLLILKHWGSVIGGSLVLGFLYFIDLFIDYISDLKMDRGQNFGKASKLERNGSADNQFNKEQIPENNVKEKCFAGTNLARSESMAYINLIPIPYCNASRYCEYLEEQSCFYDRSQITNRLFRLASHITLIGIAVLIAIQTNKVTSDKMDIAGVFVILLLSMFTVTYFICFFGDLSEGIMLTAFLEEHLLNEKKQLNEAPQIVRKLYRKDMENYFDSNNSFKDFCFPKDD